MAEYIIIALLGIIIGSFLNVCIYRIPRGESIVYPSSHCGGCGHSLEALDLIPVVSYLFLRGRCRYCKCKVSWQYPLIELLNGVLYVILYYYFGLSITTIGFSLLFSILVIITVIDYRTMRIPNIIIISGIVIGLIYRIASSIYYKDILIIAKGILGMFVGAVIIGGIMIFSLLVFKKEGMGMGDLKLLAMIGLYIGSRYVFYTIFIAVIVGGLYAMLILMKKNVDIFPFGPFLAMGAVISILWGDILWNLYINYML